MNRCLHETDIPECIAKGKNNPKRSRRQNYRPITCLPMMWKIITEKN